MNFSVVTFNSNERQSIDELLSDLDKHQDWSRNVTRWDRVTKGDVSISHLHWSAQGNVMAAMALMNLNFSQLSKDEIPDYVIFYGCAGSTLKSCQERPFVVTLAEYFSLGEVNAMNISPQAQESAGEQSPPEEIAPENEATVAGVEDVRLKTKWIEGIGPPTLVCRTLRSEASRILLDDPKAGAWILHHPTTNQAVRIEAATVFSTDKVVKVVESGVPSGQKLWSYSQGLGYFKIRYPDENRLVDMESYGILASERVLPASDRTLIIRVVTDDCKNKNEKLEGQSEEEARIANNEKQLDLLKRFNWIIPEIVDKCEKSRIEIVVR